MRKLPLIMLGALALATASGQDGTQGAGDSRAATGGARPPQANPGFIGRDVPAFDPGSEVVSYDGKIWNVNNNRVFRARFEKYLNAPPATTRADTAYRETIDKIMDLLAPGTVNGSNLEQAMALLERASDYPDDANLCRTLADAIYAARTSLRTIENMKRENLVLEKQRSTAEWNNEMAARTSALQINTNAKDTDVAKENQKMERDARMANTRRVLSDIGQTIKNNKLRIAATELTTKGHLQALIMQYFATRRFEHVIIANRFYRALFSADGDNSIDVYKRMVETLPANKDAGQAKIEGEFNPRVAASAASSDGGQDDIEAGAGTRGARARAGTGTGSGGTGGAFSGSGTKLGIENFSIESLTGGAAAAAQTISKLVSSLSQIDSLANEAIRDVNEGIETYKFLLTQNELNSATERLQETFMLGEYMPSVRLLPREDKRRALDFARKNNALLAALEVNDLTSAEKLVNELCAAAKDFDPSKPMAAIQTAKTVSSMHLAKARNAFASGDKATLEAELRAATKLWPRNPELATVSGQIFEKSDVQLQALSELDTLLERGDYRTIYRQNAKFIAATALYPDRQEKLQAILEKMKGIEEALQRAREIQQRGDAAGAWESIQAAAVKYPDDTEINRLRADLASGGAATFVQSLNKGADLEARGELGPALAWYLDAHGQYPPSHLAQKQIDELASRILPAASPSPSR